MSPSAQTISRLRPWAINRYVIFLLTLLTYSEIVANCGGLPSFWGAWRFEIPLVLYLYLFCNLITRPSRWQPLITAGPILLCYAAADAYFMLFGRLPQPVELAELPELFQVYPLAHTLPITMAIASPVVVFLASLHWGRIRPLVLGALPLVALILTVELLPDFFTKAFTLTQGEIVFYSDVLSTSNNGRFGMMLYDEARRKRALAKISGYQANSTYRQVFAKEVRTVSDQQDKRNVHMIVLESFLDPTLMEGVQFTPRPVAPAFDALFRDKGGFSISPVFAGSTAQAEFEALCGVPAMRELSGIEFNVFTGAKTFCLPNTLSLAGYESNASNSFVPDFFNSTNAYAGMGFDNTYYPQEYAVGRETYFSRGDVKGEKYMFDGHLFSQNLAFITKHLQEHPERPIFNYILTMYGHTPHGINVQKRPKVITMKGAFKDHQLERSANQYYYRTEAIATFVKGIVRIDPHSLIILVSDHLPALTYGPNSYRDSNYLNGTPDAIHQNRIFIVENSHAVHYSTIHHFDIPRIVLNYVTRGQYCQEHDCDFKSDDAVVDKDAYRDDYMTIMAQAMGCEPTTSPPNSDKPQNNSSASLPAGA